MQQSPSAPVSERLDRWLAGDGDKTLGSLLGVFEEKGFAEMLCACRLPLVGRDHCHRRQRGHQG
jgi:hypothetical protein